MNRAPIIYWRSFLGWARVRLIQPHEGGPIYVPIADLSRAVGHPRRKMVKMIRRKPRDFFGDVFSVCLGLHGGVQGPACLGGHRGHKTVGLEDDIFESGAVPLEAPFELKDAHGGRNPDRLACLTYEGVVGLLMLLETERMKDLAKVDRIQSFRRWIKGLGAKAMRTVPIEQLPADPADIVELRPGRETGKAVSDLAAKAGKSPRTVYRQLEAARNLKGKAGRKRRSDRMEVRRPEEAARVAEHLRAHPRARLRNLVALETGFSRSALHRMLKEHRRAREGGRLQGVRVPLSD